ncbi:low temperature requirement protein A [Nocardioides aestuarii]|uniref:Low temperature requirement protein A n=1 Tax=Nocardioides aestuarii TaxID=252231 RepID=A0ABW4TKY3_9ACTN
MSQETAEAEVERHASWAELFFDLVVVVGVAALAHVLEGGVDAPTLGLYAVLFLAFWLSWTSFMLYGNVAAGETRLLRLLVGMLGLGVMAASVPGLVHTVLHEGHEEHAVTAFVVAYVATRVLGANAWERGQVVVDFPVAQHALGVLPWVVSIWVDPPWQVWLWVLGIGLDLFMLLVYSADDALKSLDDRLEQVRRRDPERVAGFAIQRTEFDAGHLAERLGLFVIIVLGEGVVQVVRTSWEVEFDRDLLRAGLSSFVLLCGMFWLSLLHGHAGVPHLRAGVLGARASLVIHAAVTATVACVAVALAGVVEHGAEPLGSDQRWLLCGGVAIYFLLGVVAQVASRDRQWVRITGRLVAGVVVPVLLGALATDVHGSTLVWYVVLVVAVNIVSQRAATRSGG